MTDRSERVEHHPNLGPAPRREVVTITVDGQPLTGYAGEVLAATLMAHGMRTLRTTDGERAPRGIYCAIGHCFECQVTVDGQPGARACLTPVREGMRVTTGQGDPLSASNGRSRV
jgi:sarcosine oxidase subunit alpha